MGHRCNLIVIENGQTEIYYDHWAATRLDEVVFWGAEHVKDFCRQREQDKTAILDDVWAEGGLVLDCDKKHLLWYGGGDVMCDPLHHKVFSQILPQNWKGWSVKWAIGGQLEIGRYIGIPDDELLSGHDSSDRLEVAEFRGDEEYRFFCANLICSYSKDSQSGAALLLTPLDIIGALSKSHPDEIIELVQRSEFKDIRTEDEMGEGLHELIGGFHLNFESRAIKIWHSRPEERQLEALASAWPEWTVVTDPDFNWHKDILPNWSWGLLDIPNAEDMRRDYESRKGKVESNPALKLAERLENEGEKNVQISAAALENRSYYSPKTSNLWTKFKSIIGKV